MSNAAPDIQARIARLFVYPVKSCAGIEVREALLTETGFDLDRAWMVVDENNAFVTQRELPRMALVRPQLRHSDVVLRAPGMLALHLSVDTVEEPVRVRVWDDEVAAYDMGATAAQWFSDFLGQKLRLVRFDPEQQRLSSKAWTGELDAPNQFSDGFPLLVASTASLDDLNRRLQAAGHAAVGIERFRPNIVIEGVDAHDEDRVDELRVETDEGPVVLRPVKPCARCPIPDIDPATAETGTAVNEVLRTYRSDPRVKGGLTFAMNTVVVEGVDRTLRVGQAATGSFRFD